MVLGSINGLNGATADTKVGIGTTAPDSLFSVADKFMVNANGELQYDNAVSNMMYMFRTPGATTKMVIAHSPANTNYGLQYDDVNDRFNFIGAGNTVMSVGLVSRFSGVNILPTAGTSTGQFQIENSAAANDILGLYNIGSGNRWTYWVSSAVTNSNLSMYYNGTLRGTWDATNGVYTSFSDRNLKKDIADLTPTLQKNYPAQTL